MKAILRLVLSAASALSVHTQVLAAVVDAQTQRSVPDAVALTWTDANPVDVYQASGPDFSPRDARPLAKGVTEGRFRLDQADLTRRYFILIDTRDHSALRVAERLVPLEQGSNFRDVGGYAGAGGRHVRWGLIYRSAGQPMLSEGDVARIHKLGVAQLVDLRSSEERLMAPSRITGVPATFVGYSLKDMMNAAAPGQSHLSPGPDLYRNFPTFLAPQLRVVFADLLNKQTPIAYNCSAGQDRTGFVTAMILSALGVPRPTILEDYLLSTPSRRPEFEMPVLDPNEHPNDPVYKMFAQYRSRPNWQVPQPLKDAQGRPFLLGAFQAIDAKWGSVDAYLEQEIGIGPADIARLRRMYME